MPPYHQTPYKSVSSTKHSTTVSDFTLNSTNHPLRSCQCIHRTKPIIVSLRKPTSCLSRASFTDFFVDRALLAASCRQHCYLEAIRAEVPELVEKDKMGDGVQGEPDLSGKIVQDNLETEEWGAVLGCRYGH
jgi:hypothetical protein